MSLATTKTVSPALVVGQTSTYTITVSNSGTGPTTEPTVTTDVIDATLTIGAVSAGCAVSGQTVTCTTAAGGIAAGSSVSYTIAVTPTQANSTGITNTATTTGDNCTGTSCTGTSGPDVVNDALTDAPVLLRISKQSNVREASVGDFIRYTLSVENVGDTDLVNGYIVDSPPAGFSYVEGSLLVRDGDNMGTVSGQSPLRFDGLDVAAGESATLVYLMRVGAGVRAGIQVNQARGYSLTGKPSSNVATAEVVVAADASTGDALVFGTVFDDRDGDGWQDSAALSDLHVQGGFAPGAYVANSTTVDRGTGPQPEPDASSPMLHGIALGGIRGRQSDADPVGGHQVVVRQLLSEPAFTDDFVLTSAEGVTVKMDADGNTTVERRGEAAKGLNAAAPRVTRHVAPGEKGYVVEYVIANNGVDERGIPGVRIASVEGLLVETDQFGRYHLAGIAGGAWERGRNFILKVDPATLPAGAEFTTDNPLLRRINPGVPARFDWGIKLPVRVIEGGTEQREMELGEVLFAPGSAEVRTEYVPVLERMAAWVREHRGGEVVIDASATTEDLAFDRAVAVREALLPRLEVGSRQGLIVSVRANVHDPDSMMVSLDEGGTLLGSVLFDTDASTVRAEFVPLLDKMAERLEQMGGGVVAIIGHSDKRGSRAYNGALGMRRATAVYQAISERLSPEVRVKVRVEASSDPTAPVDVKRN